MHISTLYWLEPAQPSCTTLHQQHGLNWPKQRSTVCHLLAQHGAFLWTREGMMTSRSETADNIVQKGKYVDSEFGLGVSLLYRLWQL